MAAVPVLDWFDRKFTFDLPLGAYPAVVERLRGTPARLSDRVGRLPAALLRRRAGDDWSIQEHSGHLLDLGALDRARLEDYRAGRATLYAADVGNRRTYEANHNANQIANILAAFRAEREALVCELEVADAAFAQRMAFHPRLKVQLRVLDWAYFVAEHDDHHLAQISALLRTWGGAGQPG